MNRDIANHDSELRRRILAIDDDSTTLLLLEKVIDQMGYKFIHASSGSEGLEKAITEKPDLILLDIMMPELHGFEVCRRLKKNNQTHGIPVVFVTAKHETEDKITALELGSVDYITKPIDLDELRHRIVIIMQMIKTQERLLTQAYSDELTSLTNRRRFNEILEREVLLARTHTTPLSLIMLDIDHFKKFNDTYGHLGGDMVLKQLAEILKENVYPLDVVARYGGEEFVILMPNTSCEKASQVGQKLRRLVKAYKWRLSSEEVSVTVSMGLDAVEGGSATDPEELIRRADTALYVAKEQGRDCLVRWDQIDITHGQVQLDYKEYNHIKEMIIELSSDLRRQSADKLFKLIHTTLNCIEPYAIGHINNVRIYSRVIAKEFELDEEFLLKLDTAAKLYNLGKVSIPERILSKTTSLNPSERQIVQQLPLISLKLLEPLGLYSEVIPIIRHHSEWFDGSGYPDGLQGKHIPFGARVLAVANSFDAITSERPYRQTCSLDEGLEELKKCVVLQFDPEVVGVFVRAAEKHTDDWPLSVKQPSEPQVLEAGK